MTVFVTGGSGFIGGHLVRRLLQEGHHVRALVRNPASPGNLAGLPVEITAGDLRNRDSLMPGLKGATLAYHCAADYRLWLPDPKEIYDINVEGTRNLLNASRECGVESVVYTSSVATIKIPEDGTLGREDLPVTLEDMIGDYKRSKFLAEQVALGFAQDGYPVFIVNPTAPIGSHDLKPTPTGSIVLSFLQGKMPAYVDTGLNPVHVRDVVEGHMLVTQRGRPGERYILGNRNMTLKEILDLLARISGRRAPRICIPYPVAYAFAVVTTTIANRITHRAPMATLDSVRMSRHKMWYDCSKAVRELGLPQTPVEQAFGDAVDWFREEGYVP